MDAIMQLLAQVVVMAILVGYFALMAAAGVAVLWFVYHRLHDHWTLAQTWQQARFRLFH